MISNPDAAAAAGEGSLALLAAYVLIALLGSFLCSLLEAGLLSSRLVELEERRARGDAGAVRLLELKRHRIEDAISAILILNTFAHTVGAAAAGNEAGKIWDDRVVGILTFVLTLLILFFTEIVPKTLGTVYASRLVGFVGRATLILIWVLKPAVVVTRILTSFLAKKERKLISRGELAAMVAMAAREGTLRDADSRMVANVLRYHEIQVEDVMTPRTVIAMQPANSTIQEFLTDEHSHVYSRIPLYDSSPDEVVGYVLAREVLAAAARGKDPDTPLAAFLRKAIYMPEQQSVDRALRRLTEGREHLALVTDEYGGISGLVTLEDLTETILGIEIVDESDRVVDLRAEAVKLRQKRLEELRRWRGERAIGDDARPSAESSP